MRDRGRASTRGRRELVVGERSVSDRLSMVTRCARSPRVDATPGSIPSSVSRTSSLPSPRPRGRRHEHRRARAGSTTLPAARRLPRPRFVADASCVNARSTNATVRSRRGFVGGGEVNGWCSSGERRAPRRSPPRLASLPDDLVGHVVAVLLRVEDTPLPVALPGVRDVRAEDAVPRRIAVRDWCPVSSCARTVVKSAAAW